MDTIGVITATTMDHLLQMTMVTSAMNATTTIKPVVEVERLPNAATNATVVYKKYRDSPDAYFDYDTDYAKELSTIFFRDIDVKTQHSFNLATEHLMYDKQIRRSCLLDAIEDYHRFNGKKLVDSFTNAAYNHRPGIPCVIC